jgi:valyl-tRNA synthetase
VVRPLDEVASSLELADRWILSRFSAATREVTRQLEGFRFHEAAEAAYHFFWGEFADWYIELVKPRLREDAEPASRDAARATLVAVLDGVLRLLHPIMPFVTEELWQSLPVPDGATREESLVVARWPEPDGRRDDAQAEAQLAELMELIGLVRTLRSEYNVPESSHVDVHLANLSPALSAALAAEERALLRLARVRAVASSPNGSAGAGAHGVLRSGTELFVPLAGIIDLERERSRLRAELERLDGQLRATEGKLGKQDFVSRAPAEVVQREREKAQSFRDQRERLSAKLTDLA